MDIADSKSRAQESPPNGGCPFYEIIEGESPLVAAALHHGHDVRPEVARILAISDLDRLREEDPFTGTWTRIALNRILVHQSRFEVDLNRARDQAVYRRPKDFWNLSVWKRRPSQNLIKTSLALYDDFYTAVRALLSRLEHQFGSFVVFDLHSYNHRRDGPTAPAADQETHPDVNVGTGAMDRRKWGLIVDRFVAELRSCEAVGTPLDVRENVKFQGGHFSRWVCETFPASACVLSVEVKKTFMDEWTGEPNHGMVKAIGEALSSTVPGVLEELTCRQGSAPRSDRISSPTSSSAPSVID